MFARPPRGSHPLVRFAPREAAALQALRGPVFERHLLSCGERIMAESSRQGKYDSTYGPINNQNDLQCTPHHTRIRRGDNEKIWRFS
jgi:hypothetical protein